MLSIKRPIIALGIATASLSSLAVELESIESGYSVKYYSALEEQNYFPRGLHIGAELNSVLLEAASLSTTGRYLTTDYKADSSSESVAVKKFQLAVSGSYKLYETGPNTISISTSLLSDWTSMPNQSFNEVTGLLGAKITTLLSPNAQSEFFAGYRLSEVPMYNKDLILAGSWRFQTAQHFYIKPAFQAPIDLDDIQFSLSIGYIFN